MKLQIFICILLSLAFRHTYASQNGDYVKKRAILRSQIFNLNLTSAKSDFQGNDNARNLVYNQNTYIDNFNTMLRFGLTRAAVSNDPWSGHVWGIYKGLIANRYNDLEFSEASKTWFRGYRFIRQNPASVIYATGDIDKINNLSPAEKYDLVFNTNFALTNYMWNEGKKYFDQTGTVETWMGICHGTSPASFAFKRPHKAVVIPSFQKGLPITFYPSDIKALAAQLYAYAKVNVNFIGSRCNERHPNTDTRGRVTNKECLDTNPASFHMALINQIGRVGIPFIMDTSWNYEVWNSPTVAYRFVFFNPYTDEVPRYVRDAVVEMDYWKEMQNFSEDPYRYYRSSKARYLVGVSATVTNAASVTPNHKLEDSSVDDRNYTQTYRYDLELDQNYTIIGGEWHSENRPDFLWVQKQNIDVLTPGDIVLVDHQVWSGTTRAPGEWSKQAALMAQSLGSPLAFFVEKLINLANQE